MTQKIIPLKTDIIYGPVSSRRLGRSLGLNILPPDAKACPFDCLYCQYGRTRIHAFDLSALERLPGAAEIEAELMEALKRIPAPEYLTLSGNGEATLHPDFSKIVTMVKTVRNRYAPQARTAILSNSTTVGDVKIRRALEELDVRIMKLDAGSAEVFRSYNIPCKEVGFEATVEGLAALQDVTIQTLFSGGPAGNFTPDNIEGWIECLRRVQPIAVQIYSLDRGTLSREISPVRREELESLAHRLQGLGFNAQAYARASS